MINIHKESVWRFRCAFSPHLTSVTNNRLFTCYTQCLFLNYLIQLKDEICYPEISFDDVQHYSFEAMVQRHPFPIRHHSCNKYGSAVEMLGNAIIT